MIPTQEPSKIDTFVEKLFIFKKIFVGVGSQIKKNFVTYFLNEMPDVLPNITQDEKKTY